MKDPATRTVFAGVDGRSEAQLPDWSAEQREADDPVSFAEANAASPFPIDVWTLHSGATYTLTHFVLGKEGTALDRYVRVANDILFNPEGTAERVEQAYEEQLAVEESDGSQRSLAGERVLASIERVSEDVRAKAAQFADREEALRERFQQAMDQVIAVVLLPSVRSPMKRPRSSSARSSVSRW